MAEATVKIADEFKILKKKWKHFYLKENPPWKIVSPGALPPLTLSSLRLTPELPPPL